MCGPRRAKNNSSCAAFRCAMARERDRAPQIRTTGFPVYTEGQGQPPGVHRGTGSASRCTQRDRVSLPVYTEGQGQLPGVHRETGSASRCTQRDRVSFPVYTERRGQPPGVHRGTGSASRCKLTWKNYNLFNFFYCIHIEITQISAMLRVGIVYFKSLYVLGNIPGLVTGKNIADQH